MNSSNLFVISTNDLLTAVAITALCVVGLVNFCATAHKRRWVLVFTIGCGLLNTPLCSSEIRTVADILLLSVALSTLCYDVIKNGIPTLLMNIVNKRIGGGDSNASDR